MYENNYHYSVGNRKTLDKLQAIIWASDKNEWINYHLPEWLKELPTHIEPEQGMDELCRNRAHQLRDSSNYIRLWFSGGCDSRYMLDTFVDNEIHIDEIICTKAGIPEADWEIDQVAIPYLENIKDKIPYTKITIKQPTWQDYKDWYSDPYWFEKYHKVQRYSKSFFGIRLNEKLESIRLQDYHKGTANVLGLDKPCVFYINGEWFTYFLDTKIEHQPSENDNQFHAFYNDDPLIFIKQCHMLKRGIMSNVKDVKDYNKVSQLDERYQRVYNESIGRIAQKSFFIKKSYKAIDGFVGHNSKESIGKKYILENFPEVYQKYLEGLKNLSLIQNGKWFNKNDATHGDVGIFAEFKSLDNNKIMTVDELYPNGFIT